VGTVDTEEMEVRMLVHQSQSGQIIGKGGEKVKQLRAVSVLHYFCCSYVSRKLCTVFLFIFSALESLGCNSCMWQTCHVSSAIVCSLMLRSIQLVITSDEFELGSCNSSSPLHD